MRANIKVGAYYKTRDNTIVGPFRQQKHVVYPYIAPVNKLGDTSTKEGFVVGEDMSYTAKGKFLSTYGRSKHAMDLITEVKFKVDNDATVASVDAKPIVHITPEVGKCYCTRSGELTGPIRLATKNDTDSLKAFPFIARVGGEEELFTSLGTYWSDARKCDHDLVEEAPAKKPRARKSKPDKAPAVETQPVTDTGITLVVGGFYRDRAGNVVGPMEATENITYPFSGKVACPNGATSVYSYASDGGYLAEEDGGRGGCFDIVSTITTTYGPDTTKPVDPPSDDLIISRKLVDYIMLCAGEIIRPNMDTGSMHDKAKMYEGIVKRSGDMGMCISRALSESRLTPIPEPGYGVETPVQEALRVECNRVARINHERRLARSKHIHAEDSNEKDGNGN